MCVRACVRACVHVCVYEPSQSQLSYAVMAQLLFFVWIHLYLNNRFFLVLTFSL